MCSGARIACMMATPVAGKRLEVEDVFDMSADEVRQEVERLGHEAKGLNKVQLQKVLVKLISPKIKSPEDWRLKAKALELKVQKETEEADRVQRKDAQDFELAKLKIEAEERRMQAQVEERRMQAQTEARRMEMEENEKQRQYELELRRIDRPTADGSERTNRDNESFRLASAIKFVPKWEDTDIEQYLLSFEKAMMLHHFPRDKWTALLHPQLTGKAQKVFSELSLEDCANYDRLKQALLTAYERVPEFYRKRFRSMSKDKLETYANFAFRLQLPFQRWMEGEGAVDDVKRALEVVKLEQFVNCLPQDLHRWLVDKKPKDLYSAAKLADEYAVLYKQLPVESLGAQKQEVFVGGRSFAQNDKSGFQRGAYDYGRRDTQAFGETMYCSFCRISGHTKSRCFKLQQNNARDKDEDWRSNPKSVGLVDRMNRDDSGPGAIIDSRYMPFCDHGYLWADNDVARSVVCLRDSGALQSLVSKARVKSSEYRDTGESRLVKGIGGLTLEIPLVEIKVDCEFTKGTVLCGLIEELPRGIDVLVGNDLVLDREPLNIGVITRAQARMDTEAGNRTSSTGHDNQTTTVSAVFDEPCPVIVHDHELPKLFAESEVNVSMFNESVSREDLIRLQRADETLKPLFVMASDELKADEGRSGYAMVHGVLVRYWCDRAIPQGLGITQVVVPVQLRQKVLRVAHDIPAAGHLGTQKTLDRLRRHFWWPLVNSDVREYCRTCDICQRLGKGAVKGRAPLINLPVVTEVFARLAIDVVGPLSVCERTRNRFILTVIDMATHFPFAFPLRNHTAYDVAKCLISVFTMFGFPNEILSDCGSEFMSEVMQVFLHECRVTQIKTSPYHPQSNGCCEKFNRTLKDMLKALVESFPGAWDEILPWVLFAYREVPVQGLGFSAFDLVFGRNVKGMLQLMKESWINENVHDEIQGVNLIEFVLELRERIRVALQLANENAAVAQCKSKLWYDKHSQNVVFDEGEQVLLLLPLVGKPLQAKYCGPYVVLQRLGPVDYLISTPDRRRNKRVVHVNLMKRYNLRESDGLTVGENGAQVLVVDTDDGVMNNVDVEHVLDNCELDLHCGRELKQLLLSFKHVFSVVPGRTSLISHHIELMPGARPVRQAPYRLHPEKLAKVDKEIEELLRAGIIEESESPWAAPIVVVPKPDGSGRLCTDFRKLNAVTVPDPFPMPRVEALIDRVGKAKYMSKLDMTKGYWQIPLTQEARPLTGFVTPHGHYQWKFMSFGLRNAPATFSRLITKVLQGLNEFCDAYLDDVIIFSVAWEEHMSHLRQVLQRIDKANLTLNLSKCVFANAEIDFLGHHIGLNIVQPRRQKVEVLLGFPQPVSKKQVQAFLGLASYYRRYLPHFSEITLPLTSMLKKGQKFSWSIEAEKSFLDLKSRLASRPILRPPDFDKPFCMAVDASHFCVGACLFQVIDEIEHPICYLSRKLNVHEVRYSTIEKEALALVVAVRAFSVYFGSALVTVYTDHSPLQFINRMANSNQKLLRWSLELQQYALDIRHRPGRLNLLPDILSRPAM